MIEFSIYGEPIGKGRPKFVSRGGFGRAYTPKKTADYEKHVVAEFRSVYPDAKPIDKALRVKIFAFYVPPASWSKRKRAEAIFGLIPKTTKPDADNVAKAILDALNGAAYLDDSQVISLLVEKRYDNYSRVFVSIAEI